MKKIVVFLTTCLLLICTVISIAAQGTASEAPLHGDLNYSDSLHGAVTVQIGDLLSQLGGFTVTDAEKNFIRYNYDGQSVLYYSKPSIYDLKPAYDASEKTLSVVVKNDRHVGEYATLVWIPATAVIGDAVASFAPATDLGSDYYRAVFENMAWSDSMDVTIEYCADIVLTAETLNDFVNYAFDSAVQLDAEKISYEQALADYQQNVAEWEQFEKDMAAYDIYLDKVALYQDYLAYQDYLLRLEAYNIAHQAYLANQLEWTNYHNAVSQYDEYVAYKYNVYPGLNSDYQSKMTYVDHQLYLLSLLEKDDPKTGLSFIESMMNDELSKEIKANQAEFEFAVGKGVATKIISSTEALQKFCATYKSKKTDQQKYEFYIQEREDFIYHLETLYTSTRTLYLNEFLYSQLMSRYPDRIEAMINMMGTLYVQWCVFDDAKNLNLNEKIDTRGGRTAAMLVDASLRPASDTNKAKPRINYYPIAPVDPETYPVTKPPVQPTQTLQDAVVPQKPVYGVIKNENELEGVKDPGYMAKPEQPVKLSKPEKLNWSASKQAIYDAYMAGELTQREPFAQDQVLTLRESASSKIYLNTVDIRYSVEFINTDENRTSLGKVEGIPEGAAARIPSGARNPSKPADEQYTYEFIGWVDAKGNPVDLSSVTSNMKVYADYRAILRSYTVTWMVEGVSTVQTVLYGEVPVFEGIPTKAPTAQYTYTFDSWDKSVTAVTGDVTYTAQFASTVNRYTVSFDMGNGEILHKDYPYGQSLAEVVSSMRTPYMEPNVEFTYSFKGWKDVYGTLYTDKEQMPALTEDMSFTAEFTETVNSYTITWVVYGEKTESTWKYGTTPSYGKYDPFRETDDRYYYQFCGWDKEIVAVTGDATYTALFEEELRYYNISFIVDGMEYKISFGYDQIPEFSGLLEKQSDVQYDYTFAGWDREFEAVTGVATYTAQFDSILRKYPVKFVVEGTEITIEVDYGAVPKYPQSTPTKPDDDVYRYTFSGWDKEIVAVDGSEVIYTACFDASPLVSIGGNPDGEGGDGSENVVQLVNKGDGNYSLALQVGSVDLSLIFEKLGNEQANSLTVSFGDAVLEFPKAQIDAFYLMGDGIAQVSLEQVTYQGLTAYSITLLDMQGEPVGYLVSELTVKLPYSGIYTADVYHVEDDGSLTKLEVEHKDGYLIFETMDFSTFVIKDRYLITKNPAENGVFDVQGEAHCGDLITVTPDPAEGFHVDGVKVYCNGEEIEVTLTDGQYTFVMPNGNVEVSATFQIVEGGSGNEVIVGVLTALLIVAIGLVIVIVVSRKKPVKA